ncbi:MAG: HD domain-containing phosphohydrolase [Myxococcota bacterium]|nr:HD domain-containing phosphohydrolase [Myxococcota bacterium]
MSEHIIHSDTLAVAEIAVRLGSIYAQEALLDAILEEAIRLSNADGGSLYLVKNGQLEFNLVKNLSLNLNFGREQKLPDGFKPIPISEDKAKHLCVYAVQRCKSVNIPDVYQNTTFDLSGTKAADKANDYISRSLLTVPMMDHNNKAVGVLQLINAQNQEGDVIPFGSSIQLLIEALSNMAAVSYNNTCLRLELSQLFDSFISLIANTIDENSSYTGKHTRRVPELVIAMAEKINRCRTPPFNRIHMNHAQIYEMSIASWLHDIGKIIIPKNLLERKTKLETIRDRMEEVKLRFALKSYEIEIAFLRGHLSEEAYRKQDQTLTEDLAFLTRCNQGRHSLSAEDIHRIEAIALQNVIIDNEPQPMLPPHFVRCLSITKGVLLEEEKIFIRKQIQNGIRMLESLPFPKNLQGVPQFASEYHENRTAEGALQEGSSIQARIIAIAESFESLTASTHPNRPKHRLSAALLKMAQQKGQQLDADLFDLFVKEEVFQEYAKRYLPTHLVDEVPKDVLLK